MNSKLENQKKNNTYHPWLVVDKQDNFILFPGWHEKPEKLEDGTWYSVYGRNMSRGTPIPMNCLAVHLQDRTVDDPPIRL